MRPTVRGGYPFRSTKHPERVFHDPILHNSFGPDNPKSLKKLGCPTWNCRFTYDRKRILDADAVLFDPDSYEQGIMLKRSVPNQLWIWLELEAPLHHVAILREHLIAERNFSHNFNWTMTYHSSSDIPVSYWYLLPKERRNNHSLPVSLNEWNNVTNSYLKQLEVLNDYESLTGFLGPVKENSISFQEAKHFNKQFVNVDEAYSGNSVHRKVHKKKFNAKPVTDTDRSNELGIYYSDASVTWNYFIDRPKLVAWMSTICSTSSKREDYVKELQKYISVDTYGGCGRTNCQQRDPVSIPCWRKVFRPNYLFYLSMENTMCDEYITEKVLNPLMHGIVPIVWGGANYSSFLPPHSFIDARKYHPKNLAMLLSRLQKNKTEYIKYHVWRKFWTVHYGYTFCDLCHKLHNAKQFTKGENDPSNHLAYQRLRDWRLSNERCIEEVPKNLFATDKWKYFIDDELSISHFFTE